MLTGIFTFAIIFSIVGAILYGKRLVKNEKIDAVFGNPERAKGGIHWVIVGSSILLLSWLYFSWDIAKSFYPKSANELCQVGKVNDSLMSLKYLFPIEERQHKSTAIIQRENKNIKQLGIHFHRKTQNVSEWNLKEELEDSIEDFSLLDLVNIGGGIPAEYKNFRKEVSEHIFSKIRELREFLNSKDIKMIIEPGRFIAAPSIKLETEVVNVYDNNVIVDASVYNSAMDTFVANIRLLVEGEKEKGNCYTIKGITPDSLDIFRYKVYFDKEIKVGDKIVFLNAGAYNFSSGYFNLEKVETEII